jgi:transcriptional regulator with XRE-family HTH domain
MAFNDVAERIRMFRRNMDMSQDELAELASLNRVTIAKYEAGKVEPGAMALARIADALETSVDALLGRDSSDQPPGDEADRIRERMRRDPSFRLLFNAAEKVKTEHIELAAAMLKALGNNDDD